MDRVLYAVKDGIATVTLNRPSRLNAIDTGLLEGLNAALAHAAEAPDVDVILLEGSGRAFCAGDDLEEFETLPINRQIIERFNERLQLVTRQLMLGPKPVVCAAQGWIVGGGAAWPLNADFCVAADDATLFCPEAGFGLFPSGGVTILMAERCGPALANEILWLKKKLNAAELLAARLVSRVVPRAEMAEEALALAQAIRALPEGSRRRFKEARANDIRARLERALDFEAACCVESALDASVRDRTSAALRS
ncbi:MAG: enoyl-CoA hydratase/isomerase family protein [Rhizomicrobium sp.]